MPGAIPDVVRGARAGRSSQMAVVVPRQGTCPAPIASSPASTADGRGPVLLSDGPLVAGPAPTDLGLPGVDELVEHLGERRAACAKVAGDADGLGAVGEGHGGEAGGEGLEPHVVEVAADLGVLLGDDEQHAEGGPVGA